MTRIQTFIDAFTLRCKFQNLSPVTIIGLTFGGVFRHPFDAGGFQTLTITIPATAPAFEVLLRKKRQLQKLELKNIEFFEAVSNHPGAQQKTAVKTPHRVFDLKHLVIIVIKVYFFVDGLKLGREFI